MICGLIFFLFVCFVFLIFGCVGSSFLCEGFSLVVASGGHSSSWCAGLSLSQPLSLRSTGSRRAGSVIVALGPICSAAYGIFPDQGSNPCPLHWQADSQPLHHQGSPGLIFLIKSGKNVSVIPSSIFSCFPSFPGTLVTCVVGLCMLSFRSPKLCFSPHHPGLLSCGSVLIVSTVSYPRVHSFSCSVSNLLLSPSS